MIINKIVKQKMEVLKRTLPDLYASINAHFPGWPEEERAKLAGFVIEYVLKSGGNPDVFQDEELTKIREEETNWEELRPEL